MYSKHSLLCNLILLTCFNLSTTLEDKASNDSLVTNDLDPDVDGDNVELVDGDAIFVLFIIFFALYNNNTQKRLCIVILYKYIYMIV